MAENRLSKLQKWILDRCFENAKKQMEEQKKNSGMGYVYRQDIYHDFFNLPRHKYGTYPTVKIVTVSRALKNMEEKGLITIPGHLRPKGCLILLSEEYMKFLNERAREKVLNVNQVG